MLIGDKVILEGVELESIEQLRLWRNQPDLRRYFREWKSISKQSQHEWFNRISKHDFNGVYWQIMEVKTDSCRKQTEYKELVGCCGLLNWDARLRNAELSIFLSSQAQGKGYAKEALTLMFNYGFNDMNLHKITAECFDNNPAVDFYRSLGFKDEGVMRDTYIENGKYGNSIMLSLLEDEWRARC